MGLVQSIVLTRVLIQSMIHTTLICLEAHCHNGGYRLVSYSKSELTYATLS